MYSNMGEYIKFPNEISPFLVKESLKRGGPQEISVRNIEEWLGEVEQQMKESLRQQVRLSSEDYYQRPRSQWIFEWPSQVVLTLDQVFWTSMIEKDGISKHQRDPSSLKKVYHQEEAKLHELVELIKHPRENQAHLMSLGALIVLDVHSKDVTKELALLNVSDLNSFDWISQLRYYISLESPLGAPKLKEGNQQNLQLDINVKMVNTSR